MRYILILLHLVPIFAFGQSNEAMNVKLVDYSENKIPAYCGYFAFATTLKFELSEDFDTLKKGQTILVIIACPREFGIENYINNAIYTLTIYGDSEEDRKYKNYGWTIWYNYDNEKLPKFWSKELKKL